MKKNAVLSSTRQVTLQGFLSAKPPRHPRSLVTFIRGLGHRLASEPAARLNQQHAPVGMLDVERITRVAEPISAIVSRPTYKAKV